MMDLYAITPDKDGWRVLPNGNWVKLGNEVKIGNGVKIGDSVELDDRVELGNEVKIGNGVKMGYRVKLGDSVKLGDGVTSDQLANDFRAFWLSRGESVILTKWVTRSRMSPRFDGGTPLKYELGAHLEVPDAVANDQQCAPGLHVLEHGHRPEWYGLCGANHNLLSIDVRVKTADILFGGLPTMTGKLRVKALDVLT